LSGIDQQIQDHLTKLIGDAWNCLHRGIEIRVHIRDVLPLIAGYYNCVLDDLMDIGWRLFFGAGMRKLLHGSDDRSHVIDTF
jgi:hypothetical protein